MQIMGKQAYDAVQEARSKRLHAEWEAETDWRLKMLKHPDMGLSLQRVINASVLSSAGETVADWLRNELFPDPNAQAMTQKQSGDRGAAIKHAGSVT